MAPDLLLVLIHSPFLTPDSWKAVAGEMTPEHQVIVPSLMRALHSGPPYWKHQATLVRESLEGVAGGKPALLVGHSGAGALLPLIASEIEQPVGGYVFVDAGLPEGHGSWLEAAPEALAGHLRSIAVDGWVPPWSEWWEDVDLARELPEDRLRADFRAGLQPLPLVMFEEPRPETPGWPDAPCAYLQLSDGYSVEAAQARQRGWPTTVLALTHMALLTNPNTVALNISDLIKQLG